MQLIIHDNNSLVLNNGYCYKKKKPHINIVMHIRVVYINTCNSFFLFFWLQSVLRYYSRHLLVSLSKHQLPACDTVQNETWMAINNYIPTLLVLNYT